MDLRACVLWIVATAGCGAQVVRQPPPPAAVAAPGSAAVDPARAAMAEIRAETIRAHTRFLASDGLEGRGVGTRGYGIAAEYVAAQLESMGIAPAGDGGTYFQAVPLRRVVVGSRRSTFVVTAAGHEKPLVRGTDYTTFGDATREQADVEAGVVSVGFGVTAPEAGYDDYAGIDVRGKIVVTFFGAPARFSNDMRAYYSDMTGKAHTAIAHGAVGVITAFTPQMAKDMPFELWASGANAPGYRWLEAGGTPHEALQELRTLAIVSRTGAEALYAGGPKTFADAIAAANAGQPLPFPLATRVRVHTESQHTAIASKNVVGVLRGADPALREQYVTYTAHLDHLGIGDPVDGDATYNGAVDNASGVAAMLAIARAYAALSPPPRRSILFLAPTGEESGLLGADYFARSPTVPRGALVADVNIDAAPGILYPISDVVPLGADHSSLGAAVASAASDLGLGVSPDPAPEQAQFIRSDQFAFIRMGIPAVCVMEGFQTSKPGLDAGAVMHDWLASRYHTPKDDMEQPLDFDSVARTTKLNFLIGYRVAQAQQKPVWNEGDFFGAKFAVESIPLRAK